MAKNRDKRDKREAKIAEIEHKEFEDAHGIKRKVKYGYNDGLSLKTIRIIKIILLVAGVASFFLCSVLLLPIVLLYGLLYFSVRQKERNMNYGMRKELWVKLPKFDSMIAILIVIVTLCMVGLSAISTGGRNSVFAGKNEAQVYQILVNRGSSTGDAQTRAEEMVKNGMTLTSWQRYMYQAGSLLTGYRELFQSKYDNASGFGAIRRPSGGVGRPSGGAMKIKRPDGSMRSFSGGPPNFSRRASMGINPMMLMSVTQIFKTVNYILLLIIVGGGAFVVMKSQKEKDTKPKTATIRVEAQEQEFIKIKTIKEYIDKRNGKVYEVGDIRTVEKNWGKELCNAGCAIEFISKTETKRGKSQK